MMPHSPHATENNVPPNTSQPEILEEFFRGMLGCRYVIEGLGARILTREPTPTKVFVNRLPEEHFFCEECFNEVEPLIAENWDWLFKSKGNYVCIVPEMCKSCRKEKGRQYDETMKSSQYKNVQTSKCGGYENIIRKDWYSDTPFSIDKFEPLYSQGQFYEYMCNLLDGHHAGAYLYGSTGLGKTHLCSILSNELIMRGRKTCFITETEMIDLLRENSKQSSEYGLGAIVKDLTRVDVLIIDDFGTVKETDFVNEKEFSILNKRYEMKKTTIINSNMSPREIAEKNRRLGSRIQDQKWMYLFQFLGKDQRTTKPQQLINL